MVLVFSAYNNFYKALLSDLKIALCYKLTGIASVLHALKNEISILWAILLFKPYLGRGIFRTYFFGGEANLPPLSNS